MDLARASCVRQVEITGVCRLLARIHLIPHPSIPSDSYQPPCDLPPRRESPGSSSRFCQKSCKHKTHKSVPRGSGLVQLNGADEVSAIAATSQRPLLLCFFSCADKARRITVSAAVHGSTMPSSPSPIAGRIQATRRSIQNQSPIVRNHPQPLVGPLSPTLTGN